MEHSPSTDEAVNTLDQLTALTEQTRRELQSLWFAIVLFGALTLLSLPFLSIGDGVGAAVYWAVAAPVGIFAIGWHGRRRVQAVGVSRAPLPYLATAVGVTVACFVLPFVVSQRFQGVSAAYAVAAGYVIFARLERRGVIAVLGLAIAVIPTVAVLASVRDADVVTWAFVGAVLVLSGLAIRRRDSVASGDS
jgi:hypothetical protein